MIFALELLQKPIQELELSIKNELQTKPFLQDLTENPEDENEFQNENMNEEISGE